MAFHAQRVGWIGFHVVGDRLDFGLLGGPDHRAVKREISRGGRQDLGLRNIIAVLVWIGRGNAAGLLVVASILWTQQFAIINIGGPGEALAGNIPGSLW